ncbi:hypothetical protein Ddc_12819 [Ditylenchus destructor]|nr:hypothetical protein Ddc_12819 [Ditylenchus destructor]
MIGLGNLKNLEFGNLKPWGKILRVNHRKAKRSSKQNCAPNFVLKQEIRSVIKPYDDYDSHNLLRNNSYPSHTVEETAARQGPSLLIPGSAVFPHNPPESKGMSKSTRQTNMSISVCFDLGVVDR